MTSNSTPKQGILDAARKLNEQRMGAIDHVASTRARIAGIHAMLAEAEAEDARAYAAAVKAGWSESELRAVGIAPPATRANGRPPRASSSRPRSGHRPAPADVGGGLDALETGAPAEPVGADT